MPMPPTPSKKRVTAGIRMYRDVSESRSEYQTAPVRRKPPLMRRVQTVANFSGGLFQM
jgi:hypothetical protein